VPQARDVGRHLLRLEGQVRWDARRLKALADGKTKLKKLLAEQMLDAAAMTELLAKKW